MGSFRLELTMVVLALAAVAVWQSIPSVETGVSMNGIELRGAASDLVEYGSRVSNKLQVGQMTVYLDQQNTQVAALEGGRLTVNGDELAAQASHAECVAVLGAPVQSGKWTSAWDVGPGERVYRHSWDGGSTLQLVATCSPSESPEPDDERISCGPVPNPARMEYLLEEGSAESAVECFRDVYPDVEFALHPTENGFYAKGSPKALLRIKGELEHGGKPPLPITESLTLRFVAPHEARDKLSALIPEAKFVVDSQSRRLVVIGSPGAVDQARERLAKLDVPGEEL